MVNHQHTHMKKYAQMKEIIKYNYDEQMAIWTYSNHKNWLVVTPLMGSKFVVNWLYKFKVARTNTSIPGVNNQVMWTTKNPKPHYFDGASHGRTWPGCGSSVFFHALPKNQTWSPWSWKTSWGYYNKSMWFHVTETVSKRTSKVFIDPDPVFRCMMMWKIYFNSSLHIQYQ